jgi:RES domain-containing protein
VRVYRLCKDKYSKQVVDGQGGRIADGRWHTQGRRIVYCASSEALAVLEVRVHVGRHVPRVPYAMHMIHVPDEHIVTLLAEALREHWNAVPYTDVSQGIGDEWLESARSAALQVPSIHSNSDTTLLLNPMHPDFEYIRIVARGPYTFDRRLFGGRATGRTRRGKTTGRK